MLVNEVQLENVQNSIFLTLSGIVMRVNEVQLENAKNSIFLTLSGIMMLVNVVQSANAELSISVGGAENSSTPLPSQNL